MTRPKMPWFNWRREKAQIDEILGSSEGVLHVEIGPAGPLDEFANALRSRLEHTDGDRRWTTIQLDPSNSNTRYFGEMIRQIERSLTLPVDIVLPVELGEGSKLASDIHANTLYVSNAFNFGSTPYDDAVSNERRAQRVVEGIRSRITDESFCFLFRKSEDFQRRDLIDFLELLWYRGLSELPPYSFLLVNLTRGGVRTDCEWPPEPRRYMKLADEYDQISSGHAVEDMVQFLFELGLVKDVIEAQAFSRGIVNADWNTGKVYAHFAAALLRASFGS